MGLSNLAIRLKHRLGTSSFALLGFSIWIFNNENARSQSFQWPMDSPTITQVYGCRDCISSSSSTYLGGIDLHTGIDMVSANWIVRASASGTARVVPNNTYANQNHGMGNAVVIDHGAGLYSLYAHLASFNISNGDSVTAGQQIAVAGLTGNVTAVHLHFEIKDNNALGNQSDDSGPYWGYTPGHPDFYGYHDPREYLLALSPQTITPLPIQNPSGNVNLRQAPGTTYALGASTAVIGTLGSGQEVVATKQVIANDGDLWYFVYLPTRNATYHGPHGAWVSSTVVNTDATATQAVLTSDGINVRDAAGASGTNILGQAWTPERFVTFGLPQTATGCSNYWREIHVPGAPAGTNLFLQSPVNGWICGDYATVSGGTTSTPTPSPTPTRSATATPTITRTATRTITQTATFSPTRTTTSSITRTPTGTATPSPSPTAGGNLPNLVPGGAPGFPLPVTVSTTPYANQDAATLLTTDTIYFTYTWSNGGTTTAASGFHVYLYVDDVFQFDAVEAPGLAPGGYFDLSQSFGALAAGPHSFREVVDALGNVAESNESDNEYVKAFTVQEPTTPSPTATASLTRTATRTPTRTPTLTATRTSSLTASFTRTATFSASRSATLSPTRSASRTATLTRSSTKTVTRTATPSPTRSATKTPTKTATRSQTRTATRTPTRTFTPSVTRTGTITSTGTITPSPTMTATPTPSPTPFDNAQPLIHTIPAQMSANQGMTVGIWVWNTGNTTWDATVPYSLQVTNDPCGMIGGGPLNIVSGLSVTPWDIYIFSAVLQAPALPGSCDLGFQMQKNGVPFGAPLAVSVKVVAATPTPNAARDWEFYE